MLEEQPSIEREYRLSSYKLCNNVNQFCWFSWAQISFPFLLSFWCRVLLCSPGWLRMGNPLPASISLVLESQVCTTRTLALLSISRLGKLHTPSSHLAKMQSSRPSCHPTANGNTAQLSEKPDGGVHTSFGSWFLQEGVHIWKSGRCLRLSNCHFAHLVPSLSQH